MAEYGRIVLEGGKSRKRRKRKTGGRSVAALVFHCAKHVINLFIWPANEKDSKPISVAAIQGYNVIHWSNAGMTFWAVSDLNEKELMEFVQDYEAEDILK